jgi:hypothetical protein
MVRLMLEASLRLSRLLAAPNSIKVEEFHRSARLRNLRAVTQRDFDGAAKKEEVHCAPAGVRR